MKGFYGNLPKIISCLDCGDSIERTCPNKKRCKVCAYKEKKRLATIRMANNPEYNRMNAKRWYDQNQYMAKKKRLEYYHKSKIV